MKVSVLLLVFLSICILSVGCFPLYILFFVFPMLEHFLGDLFCFCLQSCRIVCYLCCMSDLTPLKKKDLSNSLLKL